ncbi:hypothetical protein CQW23_12825 [Capsicum baccatum]|uniref:Uncharacterized protein n=1 Tax=Capsicum baccatum TaxID=33114 RepID=A0A2G2WTP6_CAPBA|nr:hypothetical protein CQW23_12825 [Capsicum baccatum]
MTLPLSMRTQPKPTLDASQYMTNPSKPSGKVRIGAEASGAFVRPKDMTESYFWNVTFPDAKLVIARYKLIHILREPSFLCTNRTGVPHGETLGLMNPLSRRYLNYSFNFLSSTGSILYGGIDIGRVSGRRSISKSISLSGGTPGRSPGNISGNSLTTKTDSRFGVSNLESLTRTR